MRTTPGAERQKRRTTAFVRATQRLGAELRNDHRERFEALYDEECARRGVTREVTR